MVDTDKTKETDLEDKSTAPSGIPPAAPTPPTSTPEPEAHILEERITRVAPKEPSPAPPTSPIPPVPPIPAPVTPPAPAPTPTRSATAPEPATVGADIAKILQGVKLPERRTPEKPADTKTPPPITAPNDTPSGKTAPPLDPEKPRNTVSAVHTLRHDLQNAVHDQKISVVRAVSLEEDRRAHETKGQEEAPAAQRRSKRTFAIVFSVALMGILGASALFAVYTVMQERSSTPSTQIDSSILFAEQSILLPLSNYSSRDLKRTIAEARISSPGTLGSIAQIIPVIAVTNPDGTTRNAPASFREFIRAIEGNPPDELIRALKDEFFFGIHTADENAPLMIIPITSYDHAFAGMLSWEETLNAELAPAFTSVSKLVTDPNGIPSKRVFQDLIMRNYDVRALRDDAGEIQLYYSFPSQNMLVIAESPYSFTEILSRLQASQKF